MSHRVITEPERPTTSTNSIDVKRHDFAPNCIWTFKIRGYDLLNERLLLLIANERRATPDSRQCAGREMWQSQRQVGADPPVKELFEQIFQVAYDVASFLRWDVANCTPVCKVCWANVHPPGSYHTRHIHPATTHLSGVYYIQAPEHCGDIVFHDLPRFLGLWGAAPKPLELTYYNASSFPVRPEEGLCVLFPGYVMHEVETNRSESDRIGIAFNINFE
jgi:uncharacterized protein (TIGR02466 family)